MVVVAAVDKELVEAVEDMFVLVPVLQHLVLVHAVHIHHLS